MSDAIQIRPYQLGDEVGILAGHNKVFPTDDGEIKARSMAHWRWKFLDNPVDRVHVMVAEHEADGIVGTYVILPMRVLAEGEEVLGGQGMDNYVFPEHRRKGPRPGLFVNIGLEHYRQFGGKNEGQCRFHYGWPIPNWRIGQKYLRYENCRNFDFLFMDPRKGASHTVPAGLTVTAVDRFGPDVDALFAKLAVDMGLVIVRDSIYLNWRYTDHPDHDYTLLECRDAGAGSALRGIAVARKSDFLFPGTMVLCDWLAAADDGDTTVALMGEVERRAIADGAPVVAAHFNNLDPRFLAFQDLGYQVFGTVYFTVVIPFDWSTRFYREQWYVTAGDSDLM